MIIEDLRPQEAFFAISEIANCKTEDEIYVLTQQVVSSLGGKSFVYSSLVMSDTNDKRESFRYMVGCDPRWCQVYNERKWFINDPFVQYARQNTEPILGRSIPLATEGQREMLRVASLYGFRSGLVIPTHSSSSATERMGVLYVGSDEDPIVAEIVLHKNRIFYRSLGMELLDWWINHIRMEAMLKFNLTEQDVTLLQLSKNGCRVPEISARLDIKAPKIYCQFEVIKEKFNVDKINAAVVIATFIGLLK